MRIDMRSEKLILQNENQSEIQCEAHSVMCLCQLKIVRDFLIIFIAGMLFFRWGYSERLSHRTLAANSSHEQTAKPVNK